MANSKTHQFDLSTVVAGGEGSVDLSSIKDNPIDVTPSEDDSSYSRDRMRSAMSSCIGNKEVVAAVVKKVRDNVAPGKRAKVNRYIIGHTSHFKKEDLDMLRKHAVALVINGEVEKSTSWLAKK